MSERATMRGDLRAFKDSHPSHFAFEASEDGRVATVRLNRPERKNALTFESYAELRDLFRGLANASDVRAVVLTG
jgi:enoyl-CoA hydratase/carnithine racemase